MPSAYSTEGSWTLALPNFTWAAWADVAANNSAISSGKIARRRISALHRAGGHALDDELLREQVDQQQRQNREA